jgi:hypothetical protein
VRTRRETTVYRELHDSAAINIDLGAPARAWLDPAPDGGNGNLISGTLARASDGAWGDGIALALSSATLMNNSIVNSARAGLSNFGSNAALTDTTFQCSAFDLDAETLAGKAAKFEDGGGNLCGCPSATGACVASSSSISSPAIVDP